MQESYPCPICGSKNGDYIYYNADGDIVGCDICLKAKDIWDFSAEQLEDDNMCAGDKEFDERREQKYGF